MSPSDELWSVGLVVDLGEAQALSSDEVMDAMHPPEVVGLSIGPDVWDELDGPQRVTFLLYAKSGREAEALARLLAGRGQKKAGIPWKTLEVAWASPRPDPSAGENMLREAEYLLDEGKYGLAVVAADIHLETELRANLRRAADVASPAWVPLLIEIRGAMNIRSRQGQAMIRHLLDIEVTELPEWRAFTAHVTRRNAIVHEGQAIERREAAASVATIRSVSRRLALAGREAEARLGDEQAPP